MPPADATRALTDLLRAGVGRAGARTSRREVDRLVRLVDGGADLLGAFPGPEPRLPAGGEPERPRRLSAARVTRGLGDRARLVRRAARLGRERGERVFLVGGAVRDLLAGRRVRDVDLVVEGDAAGLARALADAAGLGLQVHRRFGAARLDMPDGSPVDVHGARRETYAAPGALPRVRAAGLRHDLARRDVTVNAMALDPLTRRLHDPLGGREDLVHRRLRLLHPLSLVEDPTRALRVVRLEARLRLRPERLTRALLAHAARTELLERVSATRLVRELRATAAGRGAARAFLKMARLGLLDAIVPPAARPRGLSRRLARAEELLATARRGPAGDTIRPLAVFLGVIGEAATAGERAACAGRLGLSGEERRALGPGRAGAVALRRRLAAVRRDSSLRRLGDAWPPETLLAAATGLSSTAARRRVVRYLTRLRHVHLAIGGGDLIAAGLPSGPRLGRILDAVLDARLDGVVRGRAGERALALRLASRRPA